MCLVEVKPLLLRDMVVLRILFIKQWVKKGLNVLVMSDANHLWSWIFVSTLYKWFNIKIHVYKIVFPQGEKVFF